MLIDLSVLLSINMKTFNAICIITLAYAINATAENHFPIFSEAPLEVAIPIGMQGYQSIPKDQPSPKYEVVTNTVGTNAIVTTNALFTLIGQIFTNANESRIQLTSEGFSGITDKSTPWKTLTELLAIYQQGSDEKKIRSLYTASSQAFFDKIYGTPEMTSKMQAHGSSMANMQAVLGFDFDAGFVAFIKVTKTSGTTYMNPFYLVKTNGAYLLSTFNNNSKMIQNIEVFFNTHSATDLIK